MGELWNPGAVVIVQPGATKTIWARLSAPLAAAPTLTWAAYTANGAPLSSGVTVVATPYAQRVQLDITNTTTRTAYLNTLTLTGPTLIADAKRDAIRTSTHPFWTNRPPRARTIRSNPYIQTETQAATIAAYALQRQHLPLLTATVPNVDRHDLRLGYLCASPTPTPPPPPSPSPPPSKASSPPSTGPSTAPATARPSPSWKPPASSRLRAPLRPRPAPHRRHRRRRRSPPLLLSCELRVQNCELRVLAFLPLPSPLAPRPSPLSLPNGATANAQT
ncbi:MAG: hypothetical protein IPM07_19230 [Anaerolineales bacterium]|nr:hypothetical protein [Anaerolineales bacterium]